MKTPKSCPANPAAEIEALRQENRRLAETVAAHEVKLARLARQAALRGDIGAILMSGAPLIELLQHATEAIVDRLEAAFARIWLYRPESDDLELVTSAGVLPRPHGQTQRIPMGKLVVGHVAAVQQPYLTHDAPNDPRLAGMKDCLLEHGLTSMAAYPMVVEGGLVGVMAMFSGTLIPEDTIEALGAIAGGLGQGVARLRLQEEQLERLREVDRLKNDFLNAASHELRTPLMSIVGYAEFLEDDVAGSLTNDQREFVQQIQAGSRRLQRLVDDLLDFARLEAGKVELVWHEAAIGPLLRSEVASLLPQAREKRLTLEVEAPADAPTMRLDALRVGQVLLNLVGNAIKFTPEGGRVTVRLEAEAGGVRISVADTGIGIAPEHRDRLFEKFYQVDPSLTRAHGGAGLGLAICRLLVGAHGGTLGVESTPGRGSTFWFTLPA